MSEVCAKCGSDAETPHFDTDPSHDTLCCECFKDAYPFHDSCTHDACDEDEHTLEWDRTAFVCASCDVSAQTLTDHLRHDLTPDMSDPADASDTTDVDSDTEVEVEVEVEDDDTPDQVTLGEFGEVTA